MRWVTSAGIWKAILDPVQAGGPYNLTAVQGGSKILFTDVLFGDVWLCGGQSNMAFTLGQVTAPLPFSLNRNITQGDGCLRIL